MNTPRLNLLPRHLIGRHSSRRAVRAWSVTLGGYAALATVACVAVTIPVGANGTDLRADLERLSRRAEKAEGERTALEKSVGELRKRLAAARSVGEHPDWSALLSAIAQERGGAMVLESFSLVSAKVDVPVPAPAPNGESGSAGGTGARKPKTVQRTQYTVKLSGHADGPGGVFAFARRVEQMNVFDTVTVKDTRSASIGTLPTIRFEIEAILADATGLEGAR